MADNSIGQAATDDAARLPVGWAFEPAPAKINLDLMVTARRFDGYHELDSLVVFTRFGDELRYIPAERFQLEIDGPFAGQTPRLDNLVLHAAARTASAYPSMRPLHFRLTKNLPLASGMGGGSADAAAAMRAMVMGAGLVVDDEHLRDIGLTLGADIPVCIFSGTSRMRGIGERLDPVRGLPELPLLLVNPGVAVPTRDVFRELGGHFGRTGRPTMPIQPSVTSFGVWLQSCRNDLEGPAMRLAPVIAQALDAIRGQEGVLVARMSGSGATCFGLFTDVARADRAAARIAHLHPEWWVAATLAN